MSTHNRLARCSVGAAHHIDARRRIFHLTAVEIEVTDNLRLTGGNAVDSAFRLLYEIGERARSNRRNRSDIVADARNCPHLVEISIGGAVVDVRATEIPKLARAGFVGNKVERFWDSWSKYER